MSEVGAEGGGGDSGAEGDAFVELLLQEVQDGDLESPSVQMLVEMAKSGDSDTVADALSYLVEAGVPDKAASCLRRIMETVGSASAAPESDGAVDNSEAPSDSITSPAPASTTDAPASKTETLNFAFASKVLSRLVQLDSLSEAQDLIKFLLVPRDTDRGHGKILDCYDVALVLGHMVPEGAAESAGRVLFSLYSSESSEDSAASQTLVPFILGALIDNGRAEWATELGKQLMYTTLEEMEAGADDYDYSVLGWCLAQMVWYGRADWAARLCVELERQQLTWYNPTEMLSAVASWGDQAYSQTIYNFMNEVRGRLSREQQAAK